MMFNSIYKEDHSYSQEACQISLKFEHWFQELINEFPDLNPRELAQLVCQKANLLASKRIIEARRKPYKNRRYNWRKDLKNTTKNIKYESYAARTRLEKYIEKLEKLVMAEDLNELKKLFKSLTFLKKELK